MKINIQPYNNTVFPAGRYIVIDPCYIFPDEHWGSFVSNNYDNGEEGKDLQGADVELETGRFFFCATAYGDGEYPLFRGCSEHLGDLGVDAGILSLIPIDLAKTWPEFEENKHLGIEVNVDEDFAIRILGRGSRPGDWKFSNYRVITSDES